MTARRPMPRTRRVLLLLALTGAFLASALQPADALFKSQQAVSTTIATTTVAAPGAVDTTGSWCNNGVLSASVAWTASGSRGVTGYSITAYYQNGSTRVITQTAATTTSVTSLVVPNQGSSPAAALTVTTLTSYGWTAESSQAAVPPC